MSAKGRFFALGSSRKADVPAYVAHFHQQDIPDGDYEPELSAGTREACGMSGSWHPAGNLPPRRFTSIHSVTVS